MTECLMTYKDISETMMILASRLKQLRLIKTLKRETLAERAGVSSSSLKRFETTGQISFEGFLKIAHALGRLNEFDDALMPPEARSIEELEQRNKISMPKRGRR
ncbi:MAG: helix-turn-helix transcriptional regulator [Deltaproteobacteria bacterium]|nr:helix-turn-helix transcriptional regulator [Deltaproteobacteria bacterium]